MKAYNASMSTSELTMTMTRINGTFSPKILNVSVEWRIFRVDVDARAVDEHDRVLEDDGRAKGGHHGARPVGLAQRAVGHPLQRDAEQGHQTEHDDHHKPHRRTASMLPERAAGHKQSHSEIRPDGENVAVREVDQLQHAVYHRIAERDEGINAAHGKAIDELL